jgi:hypothetical protein
VQSAPFDSGWQTLPSAGSAATVTHNSGVERDALIIQAQVKDGGGNVSDFVYYQNAGGNRVGESIQPNDENSVFVRVADSGSAGVSNTGTAFTPTEYRLLIKSASDLAILQNNGGYNYEERHDISTTGVQIDLSSLWLQPDGFIASYAWTGGDGTAQITFDGGTYTGKTIGGVDADTLAADLAGDGQGRITFRKDGNDLRILTQGVFDSDGGNFSGSDSDTFRKYSDGAMTQTASGTAATGEPARNFVIPFSSAPRGSGSPVTASSNRNFTFDLITATQFTPELENSTDEQYDALFVGRWIEEYLEVG